MDLSFLTSTWWGPVLTVLFCGHMTILCMSLYMHRSMAHSGVEFHPVIAWAMRWWLWLFTGMSTREWVAVHRKHHAHCETEEDPHSPLVHGVWKVLFLGVFMYKKAYNDPSTMDKYAKGCPNDVIERKLFMPHKFAGLVTIMLIDFLVFGWMTGALVWLGQVLWTPFWAAGVVNGLGHFVGYRNFKVRDESRNLIPLGVLLIGEELHNNHHKFPASSKFSQRWWEFDIGWMYINAMKALGLAKIKVVHQGIPNFKAATAAAKLAAIEKVEHAKEAVGNAKLAVQTASREKVEHAKERVEHAKESAHEAIQNAKEKAAEAATAGMLSPEH